MSYLKKIEQLIPTLTIEEKVGQLFVLAFAGQDNEYALDLVKNMHVGGFYLTDDNANTLKEANILSAQLQKQAALRACDAPLLLAVDQEGAWGILTKETDLGPGNLALGVANDANLTANMYQIFAEQMQAIGYNTLLSPCADVNSNPNNPIIGQRAFGEKPSHVAQHVAAAVQGINRTGNIACAKHFPGHGDTATDSHRSLPEVTKNTSQLLSEDLPPFIAAINNDVGIIMTAHINYPEIDAQYPATLSRKILTELLKDELGFTGLIITDSMNMWAMRKNYSPSEAAILALKAGAHLIMLSEEHYENETTPYKQIQQETINGVIEAVHSGELSLAQIDQTLKHVLCFKYQKVNNKPSTNKSPVDTGNKVAKEAAQQAISVLKNNEGLWPLGQSEFYFTCAVNPASYENLVNSRGIGPNDAVPASQVFYQQLQQSNAKVTYLPYEEFSQVLAGNKTLDIERPLVILTEDYPLPGETFPQQEQLQRIEQAQQLFTNKLMVLALRSDYELKELSQKCAINTYVCTYSSRSVSARELAKRLLEEKYTF
ncbi:glycoside hydrolase family 3 protein [Colwellia sp. D2M02]|uniref:glycoside hydrolase family 3 protein n=1 Tax=Colwellia sp. D2M02 TaxID=2841562 RepID=UPI001C0A0759|nr:glycoside hydrolase family 3 protein [Colwellia sp. D2M02]MBU2893169.1 glycoside hydrolase family 3 protein [Colwellia sp. D2M02]